MDPEVLIIGGGVIGLSIARELSKSGDRRITLIEKGKCGAEASWAAAGMLGPQAEANEPGQFLDLCLASLEIYPRYAAELLAETGIDVELDRSGTLYLAFTVEDAREIAERFEWQKKAGLAVEHLSADQAVRGEPLISPHVREALFFPNDWQVDNRKLCAALKQSIENRGVRICQHTRVERLTIGNGKITGVETDRGSFATETVVLATGAWTSLIQPGSADLPFNIQPVRGQIISFQAAKRTFERVICSRRGYLVPRLDGRVLAGSTTEHVGFEKMITAAAAVELRKMAAEMAPGVGVLDIVDHWAGLRPHTTDGMPILGNVDGIQGLLIASAHYRNGILLAPITAEIIARCLSGDTGREGFKPFSADRLSCNSVCTSRR